MLIARLNGVDCFSDRVSVESEHIEYKNTHEYTLIKIIQNNDTIEDSL
jgi:hypothetical protein